MPVAGVCATTTFAATYPGAERRERVVCRVTLPPKLACLEVDSRYIDIDVCGVLAPARCGAVPVRTRRAAREVAGGEPGPGSRFTTYVYTRSRTTCLVTWLGLKFAITCRFTAGIERVPGIADTSEQRDQRIFLRTYGNRNTTSTTLNVSERRARALSTIPQATNKPHDRSAPFRVVSAAWQLGTSSSGRASLPSRG